MYCVTLATVRGCGTTRQYKDKVGKGEWIKFSTHQVNLNETRHTRARLFSTHQALLDKKRTESERGSIILSARNVPLMGLSAVTGGCDGISSLYRMSVVSSYGR